VGNKKAKKRKSPQFVVQIKVVVQYSRENWEILGNKKAKKRLSVGGGGGGGEVADINLFRKKCFGSGRGQSENYELKAPTTSRFLII
jgi:hypothetical protein